MYDRVGGPAFFEAVTRSLYQAVEDDEVLRHLYPEDPQEFEAARRHLMLFLIQFWGGPDDYRSERGDPQLRMRHASFHIGQAERDAWVHHITEAVKARGLPELEESQMLSYLANAATHLINAE